MEAQTPHHKMIDLFGELIRRSDHWHFLWLTTGPNELIEKPMVERKIDSGHYTIKRVDQSEVSSYLSACDAGVAFYKPAPSRLATSPVKLSEYVACGLPVVINEGIGDSDTLVANEKLGSVITDFSVSEYEQACAAIEKLVSTADVTRDLVRKVAERRFDLRAVGAERYARLYERVLN